MKTSLFNLLLVFVLLAGCGDGTQTGFSDQEDPVETDADERIKPYAQNPYYWEYEGEPTVLIGGSWQDNLFNHPTNLSEHLDLLESMGGNYVRNVMSHRNEGNAFAYEQNSDGTFDLDRFNEEYWQRFDQFLQMAAERDIIVQIEIWATWDYYSNSQAQGGWSKHPFNPQNNSNYTSEETGLPTDIDYEPQEEPTDHAFFRSVPSLKNIEQLLSYQKKFVDKILSYSLKYPNVLYCLNNESGEPLEWSDYWAEYLHERASEMDETIEVADMRRNNDLHSRDHVHTFDNPNRYSFLDISQNNGKSGQVHYDDIIYTREQIVSDPRPINNVKNYGASYSGEEETVARMGRILFAGGAGARFHRPHPIDDPAKHTAKTGIGLGLSQRAQQVIQSLRKVVDELEIERTEPRNDLLDDRENNEAYLLAEPGQQYAVYFPDDGSVRIDLSDVEGELHTRWLNLDEGVWSSRETITAKEDFQFETPGDGHWVGIISKVD